MSNHVDYKINVKHIVEARGKRWALWGRVWSGWKDTPNPGVGSVHLPCLFLCHISLPRWWFGYRTRVEIWAKGLANGKCPGQEDTLKLLERQDKYTRLIAVACSSPAKQPWVPAMSLQRTHEPEWASISVWLNYGLMNIGCSCICSTPRILAPHRTHAYLYITSM